MRPIIAPTAWWTSERITTRKNIVINISRWANRQQTQIQLHMSDAISRIILIDILFAFRLTNDTNGIHEGVAIWLLYVCMKGSFPATLYAHIYLKPTSCLTSIRVKEGILRASLDVVNYLLETCATNDFIAETDAALTHYTYRSMFSPAQYDEALVAKSLTCGEVYDESSLKKIFI